MEILDSAAGHLNTVGYVVLMMIGFYAMTGKSNLVKKLVGMNIFQWSIGIEAPSLADRETTNRMIAGHGEGAGPVLDADLYENPLPHVLMLTAIVVGVAITGVALALLLRIHRQFGTLEENELLERLDASSTDS